MKKAISVLVLSFFAVLMIFSGLFPKVTSAATYSATVDRVVDGDTVYLRND